MKNQWDISQPNRRVDYHCRIRVAVLKSWLREGYMTPYHATQLLVHWHVSPESCLRIVTHPDLDAAEIPTNEFFANAMLERLRTEGATPIANLMEDH